MMMIFPHYRTTTHRRQLLHEHVEGGGAQPHAPLRDGLEQVQDLMVVVVVGWVVGFMSVCFFFFWGGEGASWDLRKERECVCVCVCKRA
jgi:hypothetical protein